MPAEPEPVTVAQVLRRDEVDDSREHVLRLAGRAEFDGKPPEQVLEWLAAEGVTL